MTNEGVCSDWGGCERAKRGHARIGCGIAHPRPLRNNTGIVLETFQNPEDDG